MKTSKDFAREIREHYGKKGILSDYALAKLLGLTRQTISAHKSGSAKAFGDETGERIAQLLDLDPAYVLACLAAERAKRPDVRATWQRVAKVFSRAKQAAKVASVALAVVLLNLAAPRDGVAAPGAGGVSTGPCYTLCAVRLWRALRRFWRPSGPHGLPLACT